MKKLTTLAAALLISTGALASTQVVHSEKNFNTDAFADKAQAYEAGFAYVDNLENLSDAQLRQKLLIITQSPANNIEIDNSKVSVQEFAQQRGEIVYRAVVDVDYHFSTIKSENH
ncbi:DUF3316 domain-containing protein [Psychromonas sp. 14N.309.X.WAT.B.A12]|uniref:DUF3316 domain-containing protein n=1 Tax=unclassified Psychromonas TaxID=2614957 RepID=UPI0025AFAA21|nr:DUF3316 domain-containing protein [Psychromonas sp. 14N.309.X.WAT.B.A12]MDN2663214.1 DUF3316 domain-containing protein [Psychromonas sp. 14N.309.X.WAT.B.A12]